MEIKTKQEIIKEDTSALLKPDPSKVSFTKTERYENKFIRMNDFYSKSSKGDMYSSRHGQMGIIGRVTDEVDMPFNTSGIVPDVMFNPHGMPSYMGFPLSQKKNVEEEGEKEQEEKEVPALEERENLSDKESNNASTLKTDDNTLIKNEIPSTPVERIVVRGRLCIGEMHRLCFEKFDKSMLINIPKEYDHQDSFFPCVPVMLSSRECSSWKNHVHPDLGKRFPNQLPAFLFLGKKELDSVFLNWGEKIRIELIIDETLRSKQLGNNVGLPFDPFQNSFRLLFSYEESLRESFYFPTLRETDAPRAWEQLKRTEEFRLSALEYINKHQKLPK